MICSVFNRWRTLLAIAVCASLFVTFGGRAVARRFLFPTQDVRKRGDAFGFCSRRA